MVIDMPEVLSMDDREASFAQKKGRAEGVSDADFVP
jgi:hypothetical protein